VIAYVRIGVTIRRTGIDLVAVIEHRRLALGSDE
jgi:hypothetical protein